MAGFFEAVTELHDQMQTGQLVSRTNSDLTLIRQLLAQVPTVLSNLLQFLRRVLCCRFIRGV